MPFHDPVGARPDPADNRLVVRRQETGMFWQRRRDLEGGKELGVWLLDDDGTVREELYVESHEYRGGDFDVYTASPDGEWTHLGSFETAAEGFDAALAHVEESDHPLEGP